MARKLANAHALDCRRIVTSAFYKGLFPHMRLSPHRQAVHEFVTTQQGYRLSTSVAGALTGRGADYIIIDDPLQPDEALSDTQRKSVNDWFDNSLYSRLNDKRRGCIVLIMQRLHQGRSCWSCPRVGTLEADPIPRHRRTRRDA